VDVNGKGKALITGGAGFIGSHLAEALLERSYQVTVVDDLSTGTFENVSHLVDRPGFKFAIDSITNEVVMDRLVSDCTVIFHLAAAVGVDLIVRDPVHAIETNILGTREVLNVAKRYRRKVLLASTSEIYGKSDAVPFHEDDDRVLGATTKARWSYSTSKAIDEFLALAYHRQMGLPVVIFRLFNTIGPRQTGRYGMVAPRFVQQALRGEPLTVYGDGQQSRCFCDVEDAVRAIVGLSESPKAVGQVFNIGSRDEITVLDLARKVLEIVDATRGGLTARSAGRRPAAGWRNRVKFVPYEEAYQTEFEDMRRRVPDTSKIKETIGWQPVIPLRETLQKIVEGFEKTEGNMHRSGKPSGSTGTGRKRRTRR
jgi:UDP-glucose 4-epimerase